MAVDRPGHERRFRRELTLAAGVRHPAALFVATASAAGGKAVRLWGGQGTGLRFSVIRNSHQYDNPPHPLGLLRVRRERPRGRRAAEQSDELAALHAITSSARASTVGGISRPSALAVVGPEPSRLMRCGVLSVNIVLWGASERGGP